MPVIPSRAQRDLESTFLSSPAWGGDLGKHYLAPPPLVGEGMDTGTRNYHVRTVTIKTVVDYCLQRWSIPD